jgi:signal transduction histidine kinase
MDTGSQHRQRKKGRELRGLLLLILGAVLFAVLAVGRGPSREMHEAILTSLRAIDINHASLQRDVLQASSGLVRNYDPLVDSVVNLHGAVTRLRDLFSRSNVGCDSALEKLLAKVSESIDGDEALVEELKTRNALLQNSLAIFNQVLSELHEDPHPEVQRALTASNDLGNLMMRFAAQPADDLAQRIRLQLDALLEPDAAPVPDFRTLVIHGRLILITLPLVDETVSLVQGSETSVRAQVLQQKYLDAFGKTSLRSGWSRVFLGTISVILCGYIALLIYRLRAQTQRLTQRLDFEATMSLVKARFDGEPADFSGAVEASLALLAQLFEAERYRFAILNIETGDTEQQFGSPEDGPFEIMIRDFSAYLLSRARRREASDQRFYYRNLQRQGEQAFTGNATSAGAAIATEISDHAAALLIFEHREARMKPSSDEILLLRGAIEILTQCVETYRSRREREQLEARLEHSQRLEAVGTLAGGIAHEFNNVLGAVLGYGEMALHVLRRPSQARHYVEQIVSSGGRAKHIIDQILTFSRKRERVSRPLDIAEAVADIIPLLRMSLPHGFELTADLSEKPLPILGNPIEIQQIVMNLCKNAAQASAETRSVGIVIRAVETRMKTALSHGELAPGCYVLLSICDRGSGIAENVLPHIFEPFFTTKSNLGGTGLGLAAVHGNVTGMNGQIHVESQLNIGTRFDLYFPISLEPPIPLNQFFAEQSVPLGNGQTVVIVEQELTLRQMYEEKIAALGYEPIGFASLEALLKWLDAEANTADLIIMDVVSAAASGHLKIDGSIGTAPILLIADYAGDTSIDEQSLRTMGALRKPVSSISLASAMFDKINKVNNCSPASSRQALAGISHSSAE